MREWPQRPAPWFLKRYFSPLDAQHGFAFGYLRPLDSRLMIGISPGVYASAFRLVPPRNHLHRK